ncbi:MAG: TIGR00268 family protein, partial [Lachnospiraceae bacterium]|nr:TIGR00268 family protein [Lachnospiraceae bacterium]
MNEGKLTSELQEKLNKLEDNIRELGSVAIGFSGGVDSSFLLAVAHNVLGENVIAVTGADASVP